jgi:putative addiction module killer protein
MVEIEQTSEYAKWMLSLRDDRAKAKIALRIDRLMLGNPGDIKSVGGGVTEMRIDYGPGYRVYYGSQGETFGAEEPKKASQATSNKPKRFSRRGRKTNDKDSPVRFRRVPQFAESDQVLHGRSHGERGPATDLACAWRRRAGQQHERDRQEIGTNPGGPLQIPVAKWPTGTKHGHARIERAWHRLVAESTESNGFDKNGQIEQQAEKEEEHQDFGIAQRRQAATAHAIFVQP